MSDQIERKRLNSKYKRNIQIIDVIIVLILVGFAIYSLLNYDSLRTEVEESIHTTGLIGLFLMTFFIEAVPQILNPVFGVSVAIISGINVHTSILVALISCIMGSYLGFWFGKNYGDKYVLIIFEEETLIKVLNFWRKYGKTFTFISAISPLPYFPLLFGSLKMSYKDFFKYGIIPRIIGIALLSYAFKYGIWNFLV